MHKCIRYIHTYIFIYLRVPVPYIRKNVKTKSQKQQKGGKCRQKKGESTEKILYRERRKI